jgi:hypothetical protein
MGERDTSAERERGIRTRHAHAGADTAGHYDDRADLLAMLDEARVERDDERRHRKAWFETAGEKHRAMRAAEERAEEAAEAEGNAWGEVYEAQCQRDALSGALAEMREKAARVVREMGYHSAQISNEGNAALSHLASTIADTASAAEAYRARVRREALREAADILCRAESRVDADATLREMADKEGR